MKKINWLKVTREGQTFFADQNLINQELVAPLYDAPDGKRLPLNAIPYHDHFTGLKVIGINVLKASKGWKNVLEFICNPDIQFGDELQVVFYRNHMSNLCTITEISGGFKLYIEKLVITQIFDSSKSLIEELITDHYHPNEGKPIPQDLAEYLEGIPFLFSSKGIIRKLDSVTYQKRIFAQECGKKARENNLPFEFLLKMGGDIEAAKNLLASLTKVGRIAEADTYGFHTPKYLKTVFDKYGIICPEGSEANVGQSILKWLISNKKVNDNHFNTVAVKNPKDKGSVLSKSAFFITKDGLLISRANGYTSRRRHQGGNDWSLFNLEGSMPTEEMKGEKLANFGTYGGEEANIPFLYESQLISISFQEWEGMAGRKFEMEKEFSWFAGSVDYFGLEIIYGIDNIQLLSSLPCYTGWPKTLVVENRQQFMFKKALYYLRDSWVRIKNTFLDLRSAEQQALLVQGIIRTEGENGIIVYVVYEQRPIDKPVSIKLIPGKTDGYSNESYFTIGVNPDDGWHSIVGCSVSDNLESGYLDGKVAVWEYFPGRSDLVKVKEGMVIQIASKI